MFTSKCSSNPRAFRDISDLEAENKEIYVMFANTRLKSRGIRPAGQVCIGNRCEYQKGWDREVGRNGMKVEARGRRFKTLPV